MRFYGLALLAGAAVLGACGGGDKKTDTTATTPAPGAAATPAPGAAAPAAGALAKMPATGATHEVKMIGDEKGYRFDPANITVKAGDGVKFVMVSGGPHNVSFDPTGIPAGTQAQLNANISDKMADLQSTMKQNPGESVTVSFANVPSGQYNYHCVPHLAMGMKGVVTVQ